MLIGLVFLSPPLLVLSCVCAETLVLAVFRKQTPIKVLFNVASGGLSTALSAVVFREVLGGHLPVTLYGWVAAVAALCTAAFVTTLTVRVVMKINGQTTERWSGIPVHQHPGDAHGGEHVPVLRRAQRSLVRPLGHGAVAARGGAHHRRLPGLCPARFALLFPPAPLRLQPNARRGEPRAFLHEPGRPAPGVHRDAGTPSGAHPGRTLGHPPPRRPERRGRARHRADQPRRAFDGDPCHPHRPRFVAQRGGPPQEAGHRSDRGRIPRRGRGTAVQRHPARSGPSWPSTATRSWTASTRTTFGSSRRWLPTPAQVSSGPAWSKSCATRWTASRTRPATTP